MTISPYSDLPKSAYWRPAVSERPAWETGLYSKRFEITPTTRIATAGSCFAQHIARWLRRHRFQVLDVEPSPGTMRDFSAHRFGYRLYSARYGNIYTARQLLQLARQALGQFDPGDIVWPKGDRFVDALRPNVEPDGLESPQLVRDHRADHLRRVAELLRTTDLFVFTFGLTEAWMHRQSGTVYPSAPGTIGGSYDEEIYAFKNFSFTEIYEDFTAFRTLLKEINPEARFLVTVSPVPLTATASGRHVLQATTYSKSVLRAVAGQLYNDFDDIDYFPSYEIIGTPFTRRSFYENNLREVAAEGVATVMRVFFAEHANVVPLPLAVQARRDDASSVTAPKPQTAEDVVCEEVLLDAFAR
jgi:hypothetical protein